MEFSVKSNGKGSWKSLGILNETRTGHANVLSGDKIWVFGGVGTTKIELCDIQSFDCEESSLQLKDYKSYPETFLF